MNPYLSVTGLSGVETVILSENDSDFMLSTRSAYTLDGMVAIQPRESDFRVTITAEDGTEWPGEITMSLESIPVTRYCHNVARNFKANW